MRRVVATSTRVVAAALAVALGVVATGCKKNEEPLPPNVVAVRQGDATMEHAIASAVAHLGVFEAELAKAEPGKHYSVKKGFPLPGGGNENMWVDEVKAVDGGFAGVLGNEPVDVTDVKLGDLVVVKRGEVRDWMVTHDDGRIWGGYTVRVLLDSSEPEYRAAVEAMLQPLPE